MLTNDDVAGFISWYETGFRRRTGTPPSPATVRGKRGRVVSCSRYAAEFFGETEGTLDAVLTDRAKWTRFLEHLDTRMTTGSARVCILALRDYANYLLANGDITHHVIVQDDLPPKNPPPPIEVYSDEEVELFKTLSRAHGLRWHLLVCYVADTGRRIGETLELEWSMFHLEDDQPYVNVPAVITKTRNAQFVPLPTSVIELLTPENIAELKAERPKGSLAWSKDPERYPFPWSYSAVKHRFERFCEKAGLPDRGWHNFRHTLITRRIREGVPIQAVSSLAGHTNIQTTIGRYHHATAMDYARYVN